MGYSCAESYCAPAAPSRRGDVTSCDGPRIKCCAECPRAKSISEMPRHVEAALDQVQVLLEGKPKGLWKISG